MTENAQGSTAAARHGEAVAVITGAARGIGRAIAARLAREGHPVAGLDVDGTVIEAMAGLGERSFGCAVDITDDGAVTDAFARVAAELGPPLILVNNAGVTANISAVVKMDPGRWRRELEVNLTGAFLCTRAALPAMAEAGWGRIVNISSQAASGGLDRQSAYAASKAGMLGLTKTVTIEQAGSGITCNAVLPGMILTEKAAAMPAELIDHVRGQIPARRFGDPQELAALVAFLASDEAGYVNGAEIPVDGGGSCTHITLARRPGS
ncbi:MAG TPA: SDR family oxidoreductase [Gammaproteobacteria bacterium]|nr:SDR family oxidoreductase [Gammaproteobacteria bacterium]